MTARRGHGEGSVFYEADRDRWVGLVTLPADGTGKRRRSKVVAATKTEARRKLAEVRRAAEDGIPTGHGGLTLSAFLDTWLATAVPARASVKSRNTVANYRWAISHIRPALGAKTLRALAPGDVERLLVALADRGMARNSVMRVRSVLSTALAWAQRRQLVAWNVAALAEMPAIEARSDGRSLTLDQAKALLDVAADHRLGALVTVGLMLGLRPGELCGLRWADVDLDAGGVLHVRQARKREHDDDGREVLTFGAPKTKKSARSLDLPPGTIAALRAHSKRQAAERLRAGARWHDLDLVFPTSIGTPMSPSNLRRDLAELTVAAGLGRWSPNELRHSAGSLLSAAGVPLERIADLLGHTDTRMLERVYRHPVTSTVDAAVAPMSQMFGGATG